MKNKLLAGLFFLFLSYFGYGQTITVTINPDNPPICAGAQVQLQATASGGTAPYTYVWNTGDVGSVLRVNKAATYTVTVRDAAGSLPGERSVTVRAVAQPAAPTAVNESGAVCRGSTARLVASAPGGEYQWFDANFEYKGSGPVLITPAITQSTVFYVQTTIDGCASPFSLPIPVTIIADPTVNSVTICPGSVATFLASGADTYQWYDDAGNLLPATGATFTTEVLNASRSYFVTGTTNGCTSAKVEAKATVKPITPNPNGGGPYSVCFGSKKTLTAFGVPGAVYEWFKNIDDTEALIASPDFTTPILTGNETYYVRATLNGCPSDRVRVDIIVSMPPEKPDATSNGPVCYNTTAQLSVLNPVPGVEYKWYTSATSTQVYLTGASITTKDPLLSNTTFYVRAETGGGTCVTDPTPVPVTVKSAVVTPTVNGATAICAGSTTLTATSPDGTIFKWYDTDTSPDTDVIWDQAIFNPTVNADRSYFVSVTTADGCVSARREVRINIIPPPAAPNGTDGRTCIGGKALLIATTGTNQRWYDSGGALVGSGSVFETPALTVSTDYFVASVSSTGCEGGRTRVRAIVVAKPNRPTVSGPASPVCPGTEVTLTASGSTGTYRWYADDGTFLQEGTDLIRTVDETTTFQVTAVTPEGCESDKRPRIVDVTTIVSPQFLYSSGTYCTTSPATTPSKFIAGAFSAVPAGLVLNPSNGRIDPSSSVPGAYTITFTPSGGACNTPTSVNITITAVPDASFSYPNTEYCSEGSITPNFPTGASAGMFSASSPNLQFTNRTTGEINLGNSLPGIYTITNTITSPCGPPSVATFDITIAEAVKVSAGADRPVPVGGSIQLAGTVNLGLSVTWSSSNPLDFFSDPTALNPTYTPAATSGTVTLTLTTNNPPGVCGAKSDQVVITIATKPNKPTAPPQTICYGAKVTLSATAPGGTYQWYDQAIGGLPIGGGPNFIYPDPLTAGRSFWVTTTINDIESDRTEVIVTVSPKVPDPAVTGGGLNCPGQLNLVITTPADEYRWFDADGNRKSISPTYSPTVTQNTRFFAQIIIGDCKSDLFPVDITIKPTTTVTSSREGQVCSGAAQNYTIEAADLSATFRYSRAFKTGISNPALPNTSGSQIIEPLFNTTDNEIIVEYIITPYLGDCPGPAFSYKVTVLPTPAIKSAREITACNRASVGYFVDIQPNVASYFSWSREAKVGIKNGAVKDQESRNIQESLENTTNLPIDVFYTFSYGTASCPGEPFTLKVTVNPAVYVQSDPSKQVCSGDPVDYEIISSVDGLGATFKWIRVNDLPGQPKGTDYTYSKTINEVLINNSTTLQDAYYLVIPILGDCEGEAFNFHVLLKPPVKKPVVRDNGPVCLDKEVILFTDFVPGATYRWTTDTGIDEPTGLPSFSFAATSVGPVKYHVTVIVDGCSNVSDEKTLNVNQKPTVDVGEKQRTFCPDVTRVPLNGQAFGGVDGGPIASVWDLVPGKGSGTFEYDLDGKAIAYLPSVADRAPGAEPVVLQFQSANNDDCEAAVDLVTLTFKWVRPTDTEAERDLGEICSGGQVTYNIVTTDDADPAITYSWVRLDDPLNPGSGKVINQPLFNNTASDLPFTYKITPSINGCEGEIFFVHVTVKPAIAKPTFSYPQTVCVNKAIELKYTGAVANATFIWIGPDGARQPETTDPTFIFPGISSPVPATFTLIIKVGNCEMASDQQTVQITPVPVVDAGADLPYCVDVPQIPLHGVVTRGVNGTPTTGKWVIKTGLGQLVNADDVLENAYQPAPGERIAGGTVVLQLESTDNCDGVTPDEVTFTLEQVKAADTPAERELGEICSGAEITYNIVTTGDAMPGITYSWVRQDDPLNPGTSKQIKQTLVNNTATDMVFTYRITPSINGCAGEIFFVHVTVKPAIAKPTFSYPQTVCVNKAIELKYTGNVANATFIWIGPDGARQPETTDPTFIFPGISTPDPANFTLIIKVGNCEMASDQQTVVITPLPVIDAGADMSYCPETTFIPLHGVVTRGVNGPASAGEWEIVQGAGRLVSDKATLENQYETAPGERLAGTLIVLRLKSTDNCDGVQPEDVSFRLLPIQAANAGADRNACEQGFELSGQILTANGTGAWTGGQGTFVNGRTSLTGMYIPSPGEIAARSVTLTLTADNPNLCDNPSDDVTITLLPPPTVQADASPVRYVAKGKTITLNPIVSDENVTYLWTESPAIGSISSPTAKNPVITGGNVDVTYTVVITNALLCTSEPSTVLVKGSPQLTPFNTFTPNADGINDTWAITGVEAYPKMVVDIYNRLGQSVYHSVGYAQPWDGTSNGKPVPFGVYYFVIDTKEVEQKVTGYVTVIR